MHRAEILDILRTVYPFHRKEEYALNEVIDAGKIREYLPGQLIYREGETPQELFLLLKGSVELNRSGTLPEAKPVVQLGVGDLFGFELFGEGTGYQSSAKASAPTTILFFESVPLKNLINKHDWLRHGFLTMVESFHEAGRVRLDWIAEDEVIHFISRRHNAILFFNLIIPLCLFIAMLVLTAAVFLFNTLPAAYSILFSLGVLAAGGLCGWVYLDWTNDYSIITNRRVVYQERVVLLYDSRQEAPMTAVLKVDTATNFLGRYLGYGDVIASTYAGMVTLQQLNNPEQAAAILLAESERGQLRRRQFEKDELEGIMRSRLNGLESKNLSLAQGVPLDVTPGKLQVMLANMFRMRFEEGPKITYRTHWFILFSKLFFPSILAGGALITWFFLVMNPERGFAEGIWNALLLLLGAAGCLLWLYQYIDWRNDFYAVTPDQVVDVYKKPFGREERQEAPLKNIQSIEFKRKGVLGLFLNYGTVFIRVGDAEMTFDNVFNPAEVQRDLFHRISERDLQEKEKNLSEEKERLADWIEAYHHFQAGDRDNENPTQIYPNSG